jgi:hypothetical protein
LVSPHLELPSSRYCISRMCSVRSFEKEKKRKRYPVVPVGLPAQYRVLGPKPLDPASTGSVPTRNYRPSSSSPAAHLPSSLSLQPSKVGPLAPSRGLTAPAHHRVPLPRSRTGSPPPHGPSRAWLPCTARVLARAPRARHRSRSLCSLLVWENCSLTRVDRLRAATPHAHAFLPLLLHPATCHLP